VLDKTFKKFISKEEIQKKITEIAITLNNDLKNKDIVFLGILNGAFMFAADLFRQIDLDCQITFVRLASYSGISSTGNVKQLIGLGQDIKDKTVVILEDIVDTGITLDNIIKQLKGFEPKEILVTTLLFKPDAFQKDLEIKYIGFRIPNDFIIGYGLDYNSYGRNLSDIYKITEE